MEKTFEPALIEPRISQFWEEQQAFKAGAGHVAGQPSYSIVIPPPNVTGSLHIGHALNNTLQDILVRFERMRGKDVLWQSGTDHAGIATQMVVERKLAAENQPDRRTLGRQEFLNRVWQWKKESGDTIQNQLKRLGASCDWSRDRFTMDEGLSEAVKKVFVELYRDKLIYKDKRLVNWDPKLETAISDLEVVQVEKKGSFKWSRDDEQDLNFTSLEKLLAKEPHGHFYYIQYEIEGQTDETITIATTRPETLLADEAVAVHPQNEALKHHIGKRAILPIVGRTIPIVADEYADPEKGTGAVKITPAHDFNDFEVGKRHGLGRLNMLSATGHIVNDAGNAVPDDLCGLDRYQARFKIIEKLHASGHLVSIEPTAHTVPHGDRSNVAIEPLLTDQWYVNVKPLADKAMQAVRDGKTKFVPQNWEKTYFQWLENIEPWCISRQLWWGHQIPAWYDASGNVYVAYTLEEAQAQAGSGVALTQDEDVLDTWFSSALWPFSTMGWPDKTPELQKYYPTSVLITGFDIIFFWVARMMMVGLHFLDEVPFKDVYIHALVRDERGQKMSKSKGNVIDPLDLIDKYGADAVRFTLTAMAAQGRDIKLSEQRVQGYRNFSTKLWNATRFCQMHNCKRKEQAPNPTHPLNVWIMQEANNAFAQVVQNLEGYRFNDAALAGYKFVWNIFCDWYLELAKPIFEQGGTIEAETKETAAYILDCCVTLLHPFMPFITEEIWAINAQFSSLKRGALALTPWPQTQQQAHEQSSISNLIELITAIRSLRAELNVPASAQMPLYLKTDATNQDMLAFSAEIGRLARVSSVESVAQTPKGAIEGLYLGSTFYLPIADLIDIEAEKARLGKELSKTQSEIDKIQAKLGNPDFCARAPQEVIDEQNERLEEAEKIKLALSQTFTRLQSIDA